VPYPSRGVAAATAMGGRPPTSTGLVNASVEIAIAGAKQTFILALFFGAGRFYRFLALPRAQLTMKYAKAEANAAAPAGKPM